MISVTEFEDDAGAKSSKHDHSVPSETNREIILQWLINLLDSIEFGDKSASGPFFADKFPLQNLELAKQVFIYQMLNKSRVFFFLFLPKSLRPKITIYIGSWLYLFSSR